MVEVAENTEASAESLLIKVNSGEALTDAEREHVERMLGLYFADDVIRKPCIDDVYSYLLVLGRGHATAARKIVEKFLDEKDPYTIALVLETLCLDWRETESYLERVIQFALGVSWDEDEDARQVALKVLGEYLAERIGEQALTKHEASVLELLLGIFSDPVTDDWTRQLAYFSLLRAAGKREEDLPSSCRMLKLGEGSQEVDWDAIIFLREKLKRAQSKV